MEQEQEQGQELLVLATGSRGAGGRLRISEKRGDKYYIGNQSEGVIRCYWKPSRNTAFMK